MTFSLAALLVVSQASNPRQLSRKAGSQEIDYDDCPTSGEYDNSTMQIAHQGWNYNDGVHEPAEASMK